MKDFFLLSTPSRLQFLPDPFPKPVPIRLFLKRDDELHLTVSGNKWRKLKYNLQVAREQGYTRLLTYGGAYSNHLYAVAAAGRALGFKTMGVVRGQEYAEKETPTLCFCREQGMELYFVTRENYRQKTRAACSQELIQRFGPFYELPEGGSNALAVQGVAEIVPEVTDQLGVTPDYVCCPVGTGGTLAGLVFSAPANTRVIGFSSLKGGSFLIDDVKRLLNASNSANKPFEIRLEYHFGGYAKIAPQLESFIDAFEQRNDVLIEQVYTGKMLYGLYDLAKQGFFPNDAVVVALHTGGLQGKN